MDFELFWFFCFLGLWAQYSCVGDFGFGNWSLRGLGIASFVLILLITNSLRLVPQKKKKLEGFFL